MIDWYFKTNEMLRKIGEMSMKLLVDVNTASYPLLQYLA